ncbi:hypothetical protein ACFO5O_00635 [Geojedonia litorea]|uniref:DUF1579 domain-containing protein n=1 Tax=Geojedonia litorea TaxID=1268269 RepID=A0ABV9N215_9FLAO
MKTTLFFIIILTSVSINAQTSNCNCCSEKYAEFDFWLGSWTVTTPDGSPAGTNEIDKIQNNCILRENWSSAAGNFTGTSNNFYNTSTKQWEQLWIDNQGGSLHLKGNRKGNQMILSSDELKNAKGDTYFHRVTWTLNEDGSVRQYWETITNGKDITVAFDGLYKKTQ